MGDSQEETYLCSFIQHISSNTSKRKSPAAASRLLDLTLLGNLYCLNKGACGNMMILKP